MAEALRRLTACLAWDGSPGGRRATKPRRRPFVPDVLTGIPPQAVRAGCPYRDPTAGPAILAGCSLRKAAQRKRATLPGL